MNDFELAVSRFAFKGWEVWWCGEWVDDDFDSLRCGLWGAWFKPARPHAPSSLRTDSNVSEGVVFGESESRGDFIPINVKNV